MTSLSDQLYAAELAHKAASSLEDSVRLQISSVFDFWGQGLYTDHTVRFKLEDIIRSAYKSSAALAATAAQRAVGDDEWTPKVVGNNVYLKALIRDLRRNLRVYKKSKKTADDKRRAILYMQHGAGVAAQRGYTDGTISAYKEQDTVLNLEKVWRANFVNNTPCALCRSLHNKSVGLTEDFAVPTDKGVFVNQQGPPRHPNCKCYLVIIIRDLKNSQEKIDEPAPGPLVVPSISNETLQRMPAKFFLKLIRALQATLKALKGKKN